MKSFLLVLSLFTGGLLTNPPAHIDRATHEAATAPTLTLDLSDIVGSADAFFGSCGEDEYCGLGKHVVSGSGEFYQHSLCTEPAIHFGPRTCLEMTLLLPDLLEMSKASIVAMVAESDRLRYNAALGRLESLACDRVGVVVSVDLEFLGLTETDLDIPRSG